MKNIVKIVTILCLMAVMSCVKNKPANAGERGDGAIPDKELDVPAGDSTISHNPRKIKDSVEIISKGNAAKE